jgi:hypothetical protein
MGTLIIITLLILHALFCRNLTKKAYKNGFKGISYDVWISWFIPIVGTTWSILDYVSSTNWKTNDKINKKNRFYNWFTGKNW